MRRQEAGSRKRSVLSSASFPYREGRGRAVNYMAHVDQVVAVVAAREPGIDFLELDRLLARADQAGLRAVVCVNKMDLADRGRMAPALDPYCCAEYPMVYVSAATGYGVDELIEHLRDHVSLLVGPSGVGRTTLVARVLPDRTPGARRDVDGSFTSSPWLYPLPSGGSVGIGPLLDDPIDRERLRASYRDFLPYAGACRADGCRHLDENDCAVRGAVRDRALDPGRYHRYRTLMGAETEPSSARIVGTEVRLRTEYFSPLDPSAYLLFQEMFAHHRKSAWCYYLPFLRAYGAGPERRILWKRLEGALCIFVDAGGKLNLLVPPVGGDADVLRTCFRIMNRINGNRSGRVSWVDEEDAIHLEGQGPWRLEFKGREYVYAPDALGIGRSAHRRIRRFSQHPDLSVMDLSPEHIDRCLALLERWEAQQGIRYATLLDGEYTRAALRGWGEFSEEELSGFVVEIEGQIVAFGMGGAMREDLGCSFVLKTDTSIPELGAFAKSVLLNRLKAFPLVNDGGDLGQPGLRRFKRSFGPAAIPRVFSLRQMG